MKRCSKCKEEKSRESFHKDKRSKDGLQCCCKECKKKYQDNHKNEIKKYRDEYYENNKDKKKEYYMNHREEILKYKKEYREKHLDEMREYNRGYQKKMYYKNIEDAITQIYDNYTSNNYPNGTIQYGVIYGVQNKITKRWYVGQTTSSFKTRYSNNFFKSKQKEMCDEKLALFLDDLSKYGEESFEVYEVLDVAFSLKELDEKEVYYIDYYKAYDEGYNSNRGYINGRDTLYK